MFRSVSTVARSCVSRPFKAQPVQQLQLQLQLQQQLTFSSLTPSIFRNIHVVNALPKPAVAVNTGLPAIRFFSSNSNDTSDDSSTQQEMNKKQGQAQAQAQAQPFLQNQEWVKFQQSIQVDGFQTGQALQANVMTKKSKGGKQARNRKARELEQALQQHQQQTSMASANISTSDNRFPAIRYSPEETQELLKLAFDTLPTKTGKRGTRNLKRQANRWKAVRNIRSQYKANIQAAHERRMEHRQWKRAQTKAVKEAAPKTHQEDLQYQAQILQRWAVTMHSHNDDNSKEVSS